ncbi:MAG: outer membrane lipoprotein carrier protein LolA [Candidatus Bacteroides intestinipullorum]|uniref:Outer membrane lipoprotein carrier protein LolA n=1 Tax=Candidatus Bacteroides intestinipullorum TaxID=2838471 RepID=A0A9E2KFA9_9BACE|nr:outer membrane lipoprotein carrier protein LolA [Candidatus Bacteroides intestinipullorum]
MKKLIALLLVLLPCLALTAQEADIRRLAEHYADVQTLSATVTRTRHNVLLAQDEVTRGHFFLKKPGKMCLSFDDNKDMLLMESGTFTLVEQGRRTVAKGRNGQVLGALGSVLRGLFADGSYVPDEAATVTVEQSGNRCILTVTPLLKNAKEKRRLMFTSFVLTLDNASGRLLSLRMNERGENYTQYDLTGHQPGAAVSDIVFTPVVP